MDVVSLFMSMSLDGRGDVAIGQVIRALYPDLDNLRNTDVLAAMIEATGAVVMGRRAYDMGDHRRRLRRLRATDQRGLARPDPDLAHANPSGPRAAAVR